MASKKGKTKKQVKKRDFIDFLVDASKEDRTVGDHFLQVLNQEGVKAKELHQWLKDRGYKGVTLPGVTKIFKAYNNKTTPRVKGAVTEQGY